MVTRACMIMALAGITLAPLTHAQQITRTCMEPLEVGVWVNEYAKTYELSRLEVRFFCDSEGPYGKWQARAYMKCAPRDCIWGRTGADRDLEGHLVSKFRTYNADRFLAYTFRNNRLEVVYLMVPRDAGKRRQTRRITLFREE